MANDGTLITFTGMAAGFLLIAQRRKARHEQQEKHKGKCAEHPRNGKPEQQLPDDVG